MWPFKKKNVSPLSRAIRDGRLVDMQLPPFRQFNDIFRNELVLLTTKAAYEACIQLPGESRKKAMIPPNFRWGILYLSFLQAFQNRKDDPHEGLFEVSVLSESGFQVAKTVKIVSDTDLNGEDGFVFMLPDETWPLAAKS